MSKVMKTKNALLTVLTLCLTGVLSAQVDVFTKFRIVDENGDKLKGCTVTLYEANEVVENETDASSKVKFFLNGDTYYTIEIKREGFVTKRIAFNTQVRDMVPETNTFEFFIELQSEENYAGADPQEAEDVLDYPITIIEFDEESELFDYNYDYTSFSVNEVKELKKKAMTAQQPVARF